MEIAPFETEHFFAKYEFNTPYQLCNSDCESVTISELLKMAGVSLEELGKQSLAYTESQGHPDLRRLIAATYETVAEDDVVLLNSPIEGIYLAARAALEPEDEVIVLSPAYDALIHLFEHVVGRAHVKKWEFEKGSAGWELDLTRLESMLTTNTKMVVVNFPHNPTGFLPSHSFLQQLTEKLQSRNILLFADEMYHGLVHGGREPVPSSADLHAPAIILSGLSKTYGLPGLRTGWLVIKDHVLKQRVINWKFYTSICPPGPTEFLAIAALRVHEQLRRASLQTIENNLNIADRFFERWRQLFEWHRPTAGSTALVKMNVASVSHLIDPLASSQGVLIQSGKTLGADDQHLRMGFGRAKFNDALQRFEHWLTEEVATAK